MYMVEKTSSGVVFGELVLEDIGSHFLLTKHIKYDILEEWKHNKTHTFLKKQEIELDKLALFLFFLEKVLHNGIIIEYNIRKRRRTL